MSLYHLVKPLLFCLDPELAHNLAIKTFSFAPKFSNLCSINKSYSNLQQNLFGCHFDNPIGLSAGFDKNAEAITALNGFGFGFLEVGTITPKPQTGNDKPRLFRLTEDKAIINRFGFNNLGAEKILKNIHLANKKHQNSQKILGVNIGKNKTSNNDASDYILLLEKFYQHCSYITINISSPNTANLRQLQSQENLSIFLSYLDVAYYKLEQLHQKSVPIFLKIAPDLDFLQQQQLASLILQHSWIKAIIISNTTIDRNFVLNNRFAHESGGLSGKPLWQKSNQVLKNFYQLTEGKIKLIGVGGIFSAEDVYEKMSYGASLVQIYSAFIYEGFGLVEKIKAQLSAKIKQQGFTHINQIIGLKSF
jgi:dihydroorotate dehydrogenase